MKLIYTVTGMTCNGCKASVEGKLTAIAYVNSVSISLKKLEVVIEMRKPISVETLQCALDSKYVISEKKEAFVARHAIVKGAESELKQLFSLFLIFTFITVASILLNYNPWNTSRFMLDFMGLFYIVFSLFKLLDLKGFLESFKMYDPLAKAVPIYGWIYPFVEVALGIMFLMRIKILIALIITLIILGITTIGVVKTLRGKKSMRCACLGTALKLPMTKATLIENSIMIFMAVIMLIKTYN